MKLKDLSLSGKKVLVRVDFNVPLDDRGEITDDTRIRASLPTIQYLLHQGAAVILMSHLGRPKGARVAKLSLKPCAIQLSKLLGCEVKFVDDCVGEEAERIAKGLQSKELLLLENLRFHTGEEHPEKDPHFAKTLASLGDIYVNDAFGSAHRAHSSTTTIAQYFPGKAAAGLLLEKEISFLGDHLNNPSHPFYAIIGGAKVSSKLGVLTSLLAKVDALFIGGAMAYTFLKAQGFDIGDSLCEDELVPQAKKLLERAETSRIPIFLPTDLIIADQLSKDATFKRVIATEGVKKGWQGVDIGPATRKEWAATLQDAKMVFWNGPLGVFELPPFAEGTCAIAKSLASLDAITIAGGGDSIAAINQLELAGSFSHISTGGGAALEYIEHGHLPGIDALGILSQ